MTIRNVIEKIDQFTSERDWGQFHSPKNIASSISIEAAELLECFQWTDPAVTEVLEDEGLLRSVEEEIADILIYALRMCSILGIDAIDAVEKKLGENENKYPISTSKGMTTKYNRLNDAGR